jgi:hypothetical protein
MLRLPLFLLCLSLMSLGGGLLKTGLALGALAVLVAAFGLLQLLWQMVIGEPPRR